MNVEDFEDGKRGRKRDDRTPEEIDYDSAVVPAGIVGIAVAVLGFVSGIEAPWIVWPGLGLGGYFGVLWYLRRNLRVARIVRHSIFGVLMVFSVVFWLMILSYVLRVTGMSP